MADLILAIDPGKSGGFAWRYAGGRPSCLAMPAAEGDIASFINELAGWGDEKRVAYIEKVGGFAGSPQPGSRMFTFGRNTGVILGALYATGFRIHEVAPTKWQKDLGLVGVDKKIRKGVFKTRAIQLFPELAAAKMITLKTADALLIFDFACRAPKGTD